MTMIYALAIAILFGAGAYLLLKPDFIKIIGGILLISHAANLFIMSAGLRRGSEPIYPIPDDRTVADPLVQAMTLTAIVISFGISALLIGLVYRVYQTHQSVDIELISDIEERVVQEEEAVPAEARIDVLEDREDVSEPQVVEDVLR
jgi:multicomponent Na+:H+ antiporter subunit C